MNQIGCWLGTGLIVLSWLLFLTFLVLWRFALSECRWWREQVRRQGPSGEGTHGP
jgi:hypothetical protein